MHNVWFEIGLDLASETPDGLVADVEIVDDPEFYGYEIDALLAAYPDNDYVSVLFIADERTLTEAGHPVLVVDLNEPQDEPSSPFRCVPSEIHTVAANLNLSNLDWEDFSESLDETGVFRGHGILAEPRAPSDSPIHGHMSDEWAGDNGERQSEPRIPASIAARRSYLTPPVWAVLLTGPSAKPGGARIAGLFSTEREAVRFEQAITSADNYGETDVVRVECGVDESRFWNS